MIKAVRKLKFWSRKKRKKKTHHLPYYPPPPPPQPPPPLPHHCCCSCSCSSSSYSTQPSAPPLQPWLEFDAEEYTHDTLLAPELLQPAPQQQESALNSSSQLYPNPTSSYQQYMVPNPVYGIPVAQEQAQTQLHTPRETRERSAGVFGCVVDFGIHLFRCFCPCFRIREVILD